MAELTPGKLRELSRKWLEGTINPDERRLLDEWYNREALSRVDWPSADADENALKERLFSNISRQTGAEAKVATLWSNVWLKTSVAASILLALSAGGYFMLHKTSQPTVQTTAFHNDIRPGHDQATLTLAGGKKIVLTKGLSGQLATQNHTVINATGNNIIYDSKSQTGEEISYNTLSTARGEQSPYPLVLADGSKVWLNAESSITFPTAFPGRERIVKVTGEAYFEVRHDAEHPFQVKTATQTIEDIGTGFYVKAYPDEPAATTLVEGSIKVNGALLQPGQQSANNTIETVNTARYTAWKNGEFDFQGDNIQAVMRQLARWYSIDVVYEGKPSELGFYAHISRAQNISVILHALERTQGVRFKIEGRRVTFAP